MAQVLGRNVTFTIYNADGTSFHGLVMKKSVSDSIVMSLGDKITGDVYYRSNDLQFTMQEYITYNGKTQTMSAWARECGMLLQTFIHRYRAWNGDMDRIMNTPLREATRYYVGGKHRTVREMAEHNGNV